MKKEKRDAKELLRRIPQIDKILQRSDVSSLIVRFGRPVVTTVVRDVLSKAREDAKAGKMHAVTVERMNESIGTIVESRISSLLRGSTFPVINGTGVIVHTNLGRSLLDADIIEKLKYSADSYINLEYDLEKGRRGKRAEGAEKLLTLLFPGFSSHVVNNNAAAVLLLLNTLAYRREVIVSRGELVEIGGSFRIPEIMSKSGAALREVGTTNKTRPSDYEKAITEKTALILKVHRSNFAIVGFTEEVSIRELAAIGKRRGIPVVVDQGSGCIVNLKKYGIKNEPTAQEILREEVDAVCFSGDKLLGGPQAGIIIGKDALIRKLKKNALSRALRIDKVTNSLLESTLISYVMGKEFEEIPTLKMVSLSKREIETRGNRFMEETSKSLKNLSFQLVDGASTIGGGSAPMNELPTKLLAVSCGNLPAEKIERALRLSDPPVIGRIKEGSYLLDFRTILPEHEPRLMKALHDLTNLC
ncbi:MAG: L-seryl-tRNA(Sec) selenium transferase [Acidobacteriota bacterium]